MSDRRKVIITNHAIAQWQKRIGNTSSRDAVAAMLAVLASANDKHFTPKRLKKRTFYIPTKAAMFIGSRGKIVTVLARSGDICTVEQLS
jgi:hypothetical protein